VSRARAIIEAESPRSVLHRATVENPDIEAADAVRVTLYADGSPSHSYVIPEPAFRAWRYRGLKGTKTQLAQQSMNNEIRRLSKEKPFRHVRLWTGALEPVLVAQPGDLYLDTDAIRSAPMEAESPKSVLRKLNNPMGTVVVDIGDPLEHQTISIPVRWLDNMVMTGGAWEPGVTLHHDKSPERPKGMTYDQWTWLCDVIAYNINEGPIFADTHVRDEDDLENEAAAGDRWLPNYTWHFVGGKEAYNFAKRLAMG
jgi:hypothetical protein